MSIELKIRLIQDLPIEKKHGCTAGREYVAEHLNTEHDLDGVERVVPQRNCPVRFKGDAGEWVTTFSFEYELVKE